MKMYQPLRKASAVWLNSMLTVLGILLLTACAIIERAEPPAVYSPGTAPVLSALTVSPNPTKAGEIVSLRTNYLDPEADLQVGLAAVLVDGAELSKIFFRATAPSGYLTLPFSISYYTRASDLKITLKIRDAQGNWSNEVSTVLAVR